MKAKATRRRMGSCFAQIINGYILGYKISGYKISGLIKEEKIKGPKGSELNAANLRR